MSEKTGIDKELADLRTEIYEARNLVIKSDNLLRTLHAEVKVIGKAQEKFERRHLVSNIGAYVLFAALAFGVALWGAGRLVAERSQELEASLARATEAEAEARSQAEEIMADLRARTETMDGVLDVYEQLDASSGEERIEGLARLASLDMSLAPDALRASAERRAYQVRTEIIQSAWDRGRRAYFAERMPEAAEALAIVVEHGSHMPNDFEPTILAEAAYYLGAALNRLGQHGRAVEVLTTYIGDERAPAPTLAYAHLLLGDSLEQIDRVDDARRVFQEGLDAEPRGRHAVQMRRRVERLSSD